MSRPKPDQKVILWDIDGTLIASRNSRVDKHVKAAEIFLGRDLPNQNRMAGKTDLQIIFDLLNANGPAPNSADLTEALGILDTLTMEEIGDYPITTIQGAVAALEVGQNSGWVNGLLTGNTPARALAKLRSAGIWGSFDSNFAYFGDKSPSRFDLVSLSATSIQSRGDFEVIIVGDTPLDVLSAQGCGLRVIAVATGAYSATQLERLNPDLLISNWDSGLAALVEFVNFP